MFKEVVKMIFQNFARKLTLSVKFKYFQIALLLKKDLSLKENV